MLREGRNELQRFQMWKERSQVLRGSVTAARCGLAPTLLAAFPGPTCSAPTLPSLPLPLLLSLPAGTTEQASQQKKGYKLPRHVMANGDLARLINSDEIQSVVAPQVSSSPSPQLL